MGVMESGASAVSLSPAAEPFPARLVAKIKSGDFVDMKEMLTDNISLLRQLDDMPSSIPALPGSLKPRLREVSTLPSWIYCFLAYVAILAPDQATRDRLAYTRLIIPGPAARGLRLAGL